MIVYVESHKESTTKKLLELISGYSKITGYKVHIQKLTAFLYARNALEFELKSILFTSVPKIIK